MKKFWNFINKGKTGELMLYGEISSVTWYGDEVTPKNFKADLDALGDIDTLNIYINSPGGDVFAGQSIYSMLTRHKAKKVVYVDGLAASISSVIAMAGDVIKMPKNAMMMIHNAWTIAAGNKDDLRKIAEDMEKIDETIVGVYAAKTGKSEEDIKALMDAETWMGADEAVELGFADEMEEAKEIAALVTPEILAKYKHPPETLKASEPPEDGFLIAEQQGEQSEPVADNTNALDAQKRRFAETNRKFIITED